jgi:hypothetical protein
MGYYVIHKHNTAICKTFGKYLAKDNGIACTHITEHSANKAIEKLHRLGYTDYGIKRGCCPKHFNYTERVKAEFDEKGNVK